MTTVPNIFGTGVGLVDHGQLDANFAAIDPYPGFLNLDASLLKRWRGALSGVRAGVANAKMAFIGDSETAGAGVLTNALRLRAYPNKLGAMLTAQLGVPAGIQSIWADNGLASGGGFVNSESRVTMTGGFSVAGFFAVGGGFFLTTVAGNLTFTPTVSFDTVDIYWAAGNVGVFTVDFGAAPVQTITQTGNFSYNKTTVTNALGINPISLKWVSGTATPHAIHAYNSAIKEVSIWNWGAYGQSSAFFAANALTWDACNAIQNVYQPNLTVIMIGINDARNAVIPGVYAANLQKTITACLVTGDVILMSNPPAGLLEAPIAVQNGIFAMMRALAISNNIPYVDLGQRWTSQAISVNYGYYAANGDLHPSDAGYSDIAQAISRVVLL
jgi:hypothetical protein